MKLLYTLSTLALTSAAVVDLTNDNFDSELKEKDLALVKFFAPWCGHCKNMAQDWIDASDELADNEKVLIGEVDCTQQRDLCGKQSVQGYPTLKAFKKGVFSDEVYTRQKNAVVDYVKSQLGGEAGDDAAASAEAPKKDVKSEDVPEDSEYVAGKVWKIVGKNFEERVINNDKHVFLKVYAPWCGHCVAMKENWEKFADSMKERDDVVVAEIDATANELPTAYQVRGFPTLWWADKGAKDAPEKYMSARSVDAWTSFVNGKDGAGKDEL